MEKQAYFQETGRRKEAIAEVRIVPGSGTFLVNGTPYEERFTRIVHRSAIVKPLMVTGALGKYDVSVKVIGGGLTGQSSAISHGLARALVEADESHKPTLRKYGLLTRDSRIKERKKVGLKRARKAAQSPKR
ncbi:MAG: 30S ribosomal protein S9 [Chloroflexi bacterium]|nr:30S ribosomal protein S9 [Chloroflexota bacterium]